MKVLVVSDHEEKMLWDHYDPARLEGVELILSCGDLDPDYLQFLVTMSKASLLYVRGNHDGKYDYKPPLGCIDVDDCVYDFRGLRILGLGGSMRYKPGEDMYSEKEMKRRIQKITGQIAWKGGFDVLLSHAPAAGFGDMEDLPHRGFSCFNDLISRWQPGYFFHGHVHQEYGHFVRERTHPAGTRILNACGHILMEIGPEEYPPRGKTGSPIYDWYISRKEQREHRF